MEHLPTPIFITGPTASGKTARAVELARSLPGGAEIVSADSRQVFRGMDIGTGKDLDEYAGIPYHVIDVADPGDPYNLHNWLSDARAAVADIRRRGLTPVVCGGTGLYIEALAAGYALPSIGPDRNLRQRLEAMSLAELQDEMRQQGVALAQGEDLNPRRAVRALELHYHQGDDATRRIDPALSFPDARIYLVDIDRDLRRSRISRRLDIRLQQGMVDEVDGLLEQGVPAQVLIAYGLEYRFITLYLTGAIGYDAMVSDLRTAICQFSKRQMTWFRGMVRRGLRLTPTPWDAPISLPASSFGA